MQRFARFNALLGSLDQKTVTKFELFKGIPWNYNTNRKNVEDTFLVCKKVQKKDKSEFVIKSVGNIVRIIFIQKYLSNC